MSVSAPAVRIGQNRSCGCRGSSAAWRGNHAKVESMNPSGSVKDRAAGGDRPGRDAAWEIPRRVLLGATSGNTGIAYGDPA
jgi:cysteine synthase